MAGKLIYGFTHKGYLKNGNRQRKRKTERRSKAPKTRELEIAENS